MPRGRRGSRRCAWTPRERLSARGGSPEQGRGPAPTPAGRRRPDRCLRSVLYPGRRQRAGPDLRPPDPSRRSGRRAGKHRRRARNRGPGSGRRDVRAVRNWPASGRRGRDRVVRHQFAFCFRSARRGALLRQRRDGLSFPLPHRRRVRRPGDGLVGQRSDHALRGGPRRGEPAAYLRSGGVRLVPPRSQAVGRSGHEQKASNGWVSAADEGWRAAEVVHAPTSGGVTSAGLPKRVPQANLVPGAAGLGRRVGIGACSFRGGDPGPFRQLPARSQEGTCRRIRDGPGGGDGAGGGEGEASG